MLYYVVLCRQTETGVVRFVLLAFEWSGVEWTVPYRTVLCRDCAVTDLAWLIL